MSGYLEGVRRMLIYALEDDYSVSSLERPGAIELPTASTLT